MAPTGGQLPAAKAAKGPTYILDSLWNYVSELRNSKSCQKGIPVCPPSGFGLHIAESSRKQGSHETNVLDTQAAQIQYQEKDKLLVPAGWAERTRAYRAASVPPIRPTVLTDGYGRPAGGTARNTHHVSDGARNQLPGCTRGWRALLSALIWVLEWFKWFRPLYRGGTFNVINVMSLLQANVAKKERVAHSSAVLTVCWRKPWTRARVCMASIASATSAQNACLAVSEQV